MNDALTYLNSLGLHRVKPGLHRILKILQDLGNPQDKVPSVIIAGTNGKGSVAASVASVLEAQGHRAGLYTSPHLIKVSERIRMNGEEISADDLSRLVLEVKNTSSSLPEELSYFEALTAAAFLYFAEREADFSVLEVGMGGRWDATNVVTPLTSVITNVSRDHTEFLGESIKEIAVEKSGIIKTGVPVVTGAEGEALSVVRSVAYQKSAPINIMGKDFRFKGETTEDFSYSGQTWSLDHLRFNLPGLYQLENASVAIATLESISRFHGIKVEEDNLRDGLSRTRWEGRMEILRRDPPLILDGAHNPGGAHALKESLKTMFPGVKFVFLIGMLSDKDHESYLKEISEIAEIIIVTNVPSDRSIKAEKLAGMARQYVKRVNVINDLNEAFWEAKNLTAPVCVTGSLYLIGAIKNLIKDADP